MDRKFEFDELKFKLNNNSPEMLNSVENRLNKKINKRRIKVAVLTPLITVFIFFCTFVSLVNLSPTFVYACSQIPIISDLTNATCVSETIKSLIRNNYGVDIDLTQSDNGIKLDIVQYAISNNDIYILGTVETKNSKDLVYLSKIKLLNGDIINESLPTYCPIENNRGYFKISLEDEPNIFKKENFTDEKILKLNLEFEFKEIDNKEKHYSKGFYQMINEGFEGTSAINISMDVDITKNVVENEIIDFSQSIEIDSQIFKFENAYLTPAYISIDITENESNTKLLDQIVFYIKNNECKIYRLRTNESFMKTTLGSTKSTYFLETPYFDNYEKLDIYITKVTFLSKDYQKAYIDLENIENSSLPIGTELISAKRVDNKIKLRLKNQSLQLDKCFDESNKVYGVKTLDKEGNNFSHLTYELEIENFPENKLYFDLFNDSFIEYDEPLQINIR